MKHTPIWKVLSPIFVLVMILSASSVVLANKAVDGQWLAGDFHTHTYLTDGNKTESDVVTHAFGDFGLDWMANSEHGGAYNRDPYGTPWTSSTLLQDKSQLVNGNLWRWMSLSNFSYPIIQSLRLQYPNNLLIQGLEWNVPSHEHASVGIITDEPNAISNFEYMFDQSDKDTKSLPDLAKANKTHLDAVAGANWLEENYKTSSYFLINHPSRKVLYSAADIRDLNNAAPDVAFGLEGLPGHQKESFRGGYGNFYYLADKVTLDTTKVEKARTYGGADIMLAKVGGLMDSLWGEGRKFWVFVNSDFHDSAEDADFWPGEYAKSYTFVTEKTFQGIVDGMRSGNSFAVHGDLINALDFTATSKGEQAVMGQTITVEKGQNVLIKVRFQSPAQNFCGAAPVVDHVDLIAGNITGLAKPNTDAYKADSNPSTQVVARFTRDNWEYDDGWYTMTFQIHKAIQDQYFRLRGTNLGVNIPGETKDGNPLIDTLMTGSNTREAACGDLWFYSNPVFIDVQ